jgi:hypothetical protein
MPCFHVDEMPGFGGKRIVPGVGGVEESIEELLGNYDDVETDTD